MKTYINPQMKISKFDRENIVTDSTTDPTALKNEVGGKVVSTESINTQNGLSLFE